MDKLVDTPQFALQLPVWVIMHPTKKSKGYISMAGQTGQSVMPLFTEEGLAQRYRDGAPQLSQFVVGRAGDPVLPLGQLREHLPDRRVRVLGLDGLEEQLGQP